MSASTDDGSASFDAYFRRSKQPLVAMAHLLTGELETAQDLTQEAFLRTWSRWTRISKYDNPQAWTRRVLYNLIVSRSRGNKVRCKAVDLSVCQRGGIQRGQMSPQCPLVVESAPW